MSIRLIALAAPLLVLEWAALSGPPWLCTLITAALATALAVLYAAYRWYTRPAAAEREVVTEAERLLRGHDRKGGAR